MKSLGLSYTTAEAANQRIDLLPSGPTWKTEVIEMEGFPTTEPTVLLYRDSGECVEYLFNNPIFADRMSYAPVQHFDVDGKRVVREAASGMQAWQTQVSHLIFSFLWKVLILKKDHLPEGATRVGVGLASDATHLTNGTGDLEAHPLFITLDNIDPEARRNQSNHAHLMTALLPKVKFIGEDDMDPNIVRTVRDRLFHHCIRIVLAPLRRIARHGKLMSDPLGRLRMCYTVLSMYTVDYPEAIRLAGVIGFTSPVTLAHNEQLGDPFRHPPRFFSDTKKVIEEISLEADPVNELPKFVELALKHRLTGVTKLIWDNWPHSEPAYALTFDALHSGHKYFNDHPFSWSVIAIGGKVKMDSRFKALHPRKGYRYFRKGVTGLKKSGGRDHRDMQRYILAAVDGAVPPKLMAVLRSHLDYFYIAQSPEVSEDDITDILQLLQEFHDNKHIIIDNGYRGKKKHFRIPKLALQHDIPTTIAAHGAIINISTDISEREHIDAVKNMFRQTNKKDYEPQMVQGLGRRERLRHFDLATALHKAGDAELHMDPDRFESALNESGRNPFLDHLGTVQNLRSAKRDEHINYFQIMKAVESGIKDQRIRTFAGTSFTAIHLNRDPPLGIISVGEAARRFRLDDLEESIQEFYYRCQLGIPHEGPIISQHRIPDSMGSVQEITGIRVWISLKVQTKSLLRPGKVNRAATIFAEPPQFERNRPVHSKEVEFKGGRYDCALFINDMNIPFHGRANLKGESRL